MKVAIIGSSVSHLAAAIRLAHNGAEVSIYEKRDYIGGKLRTLQLQGYDFDIGPTMITAPEIIEQFTQCIGRQLSDYVTLRRVRHHTQNVFNQHQTFFLSSDQQFMRKQLARLDPIGLDNYNDFLADITRMKEAFDNIMQLKPLTSWRQLLIPPARSAYLILKPFETLDHFVRRYFTNEMVIQAFNHYASYNGISPTDAPALYIIQAYDELIGGVYYVAGGNLRLVRALQQIAKEEGVRYYTGKEVTKIHTQNGEIEGVCLNGELSLEADAVIMSAIDYKQQPHLIEESTNDDLIQPSSIGAYVMLVALRTHSEVYHHHILHSANVEQEFEQLNNGELPEDPTIFLYNPAFQEEERFIRGDALLIFTNMPHTTDENMVQQMKRNVYRKLKTAGIDIEPYVAVEHTWTPSELVDLFDVYRHEGQMKKMTQFLLNPLLKTQPLKNFYFTGMQMQPTDSVSTSIANGSRVAEQMMTELMHQKDGYR